MAEPCKILVVDDDPEIRDLLSCVLQEEGYRVCCLANGAEVLALLKTSTRPDVIILDLMMPEMDGWELRTQLKAHPELGTPAIIYVSAAQGAAERLRAEDNATFLVKPFEVSHLLAVLRGSVQAANEDHPDSGGLRLVGGLGNQPRAGVGFRAVEPKAPPQLRNWGTPRTVLVVDDDPDCREVVAAYLGMWGYEVDVVANGQEALAHLRNPSNRRPSLILLDLAMPVMDGWGFRLEQARDRRLAGIPVVMITGAREHLGNHTGPYRPNEIMKKPVDFGQLIVVVDRHCRDVLFY